jgi:hypothetical protein
MDEIGIKGTVFVADNAETVNGKVYVMGGFWTRILADQPVPMAIAAVLQIPYDQTNMKHSFLIRLMTEDGRPYPIDNPMSMEGEVEVGRPPGMRKGEESNVPLALRAGAVQLAQGGYRVELLANDAVIASVPFTAMRQIK